MTTLSNHPYATQFGLKAWPVATAGRVPNAYEINCSFALQRKTRPIKNVLAVAAYLRPDMGPFNSPEIIGIAVGKAMGKGEGDLRNCVNRDLGASPVHRAKGKTHLASVEVINGGWQLKLTKAGQALIKHLTPDAPVEAKPVEADKPVKAKQPRVTKPKAKQPKVEMPETAPAVTADAVEQVEATPTPGNENNLPVAA